MNNFTDFITAALPWLCMGLLLAVFFAKSAKRKDSGNENQSEKTDTEKKENYGLEGMCFGMCFGVALGTSIGNNTGIGMSLGMLAGLVIGTFIEKKEEK